MIERWLRARFGTLVWTSDHEDVRINCPFCSSLQDRPDTKYHLYINVIKPFAHCFRCSWKGHWLSLVMSVEGCSYSQAMLIIEKPPANINQFDKLHSPRGLVIGASYAEKPDGLLPLNYARNREEPEESKAVYAYARQRLRQIWYKTGHEFVCGHFGWVPGSNRLWMLVDDNWWQGRAIIRMKPKYLSPPWPRGSSLWNGEALVRSWSELVICEGIFSAIHVGNHAIALCAKTMNKEQAKRIACTEATTVTIMLDADAVEEPYEMASQLVVAGYGGIINIFKLYQGDPVDSLEGIEVEYGFRENIEHVFKSV